MKDIGHLWDERSRKYGKAIEGVLFKSLPTSFNKYLHQWMYAQIKKSIRKGRKLRVLDLGCGYGRLSGPLLRDFPKITTVGIDLAQHSVDLYNRQLSPRGKAVKEDIRKLPFGNASFDTVFAVTTLMYLLKKGDQAKAMSEIFRVLKPGGKFVIIEPNPVGHAIVTVGGLTTKIQTGKPSSIPSVEFRKARMLSLIDKSGGLVASCRGIPVLTLLLPLLVGISLINVRLTNWILKCVKVLDNAVSWFLTSSLYIAYIGAKRENS